MVNKLNGKYYITNTVAHPTGFSEVLEISNPKSMTVFKLSKPRSKRRRAIIGYIGDDESKSTNGTKQLVDSMGILILTSFPYKGQLYHIVTNFDKTFLTKVKTNRFVTIDTVSDKSIWTYDPKVFVKKDGHLIVLFKNKETEGVLNIYENQITIR